MLERVAGDSSFRSQQCERHREIRGRVSPCCIRYNIRDEVPIVAEHCCVERSMNEVGVARQYKDLLAQAQAIPFFRAESYDLDRYVVGKSLDGLFHVVGDEERKIRKNPTARTTELLREVFTHR